MIKGKDICALRKDCTENETNHYFFFFGFFFFTPAVAALLCDAATDATAVADAESSAWTGAAAPPASSGGREATGSGSDWFCIFRIRERFSPSNRLRMMDDRDLYFKHYNSG